MAAAASILVTACSTVHLDGPPAEVNACRPSQMFFVSRIWPEFLSQNYNGQTCADAGCHNAATQRPFNGEKPISTDMPSFPLAAGSDWERSYLSATQQMSCTNVRASELYTRPSGLRTHAANLFDPDGPEALLLEMWVAASP